MAFTMGVVAAKDGAGVTIPGGLLAADTVGSNTGPWILFNGLVDGLAGSNRAQVTSGNALRVDGSGSVAHDAVATSINPELMGGYASAAAPTDVSADGDSVRAWHLRNGAAATVLTAAGVLVGGDATNGLDVDVTRVIPGVTATALGKAEDAAHTTGDTGVMALAVRNDAGTALATTDGDYIPLSTNAAGALRIALTEYTEDVAAATDPVGGMMMAVRRDTLSASEVSTDGDNIALKATSKGQLHVFAEITPAQVGPLATAAFTYANASGNLGVQPVALPTDQSTIAVAPDTSRILNGASGTSLTPKWAILDASSFGENQVVAAVSTKKIRVLFWELSPNAAVNARWRSSTTDSPGTYTNKSALYYMAGQGNGQARGFNQAGWLETNVGEGLSLNLSGAVATGVLVGYVEV